MHLMFDFRDSAVFNNTLYIVNLRSEDFGDFICTATNRFGVAEGVISLLPSGEINLNGLVII